MIPAANPIAAPAANREMRQADPVAGRRKLRLEARPQRRQQEEVP